MAASDKKPAAQEPEPQHADLREALLAGVGAAASHLSEVSEQMLERARWTRTQRMFVFAAIAFMLAMAVLEVFISSANHSITVQTKQLAQQVSSCTTPGGACYERGQEQTAKAVTQIAQSQLLTSWCTAHAKTLKAAEECVVKLSKAGSR